MAELQTHIEAIDRYVKRGIAPGSCTLAILENDLIRAVACADPETEFRLAEIVRYLMNNVPLSCWGSRETVEKWLRTKRAKP